MPDGVPDPDQRSGQPEQSWRDARTEAATARAEALERQRAGEVAQARELIKAFVREATARRIEPVRLRARSYDGRARYRTSTLGWYLRKNESVAVGTDGAFYVLSVPPSLRAVVTGASLEPSDPPVVLGKGGRDGESISLADALGLVLGDTPRAP